MKREGTVESMRSACRGVAQPGSAPALGAGGPEFKSRRPDQSYHPHFLPFTKSFLDPKLRSGNPAGRKAQFASSLVTKGSEHDKHSRGSLHFRGVDMLTMPILVRIGDFP
jgi:hypothetical protein